MPQSRLSVIETIYKTKVLQGTKPLPTNDSITSPFSILARDQGACIQPFIDVHEWGKKGNLPPRNHFGIYCVTKNINFSWIFLKRLDKKPSEIS